MSVTPHDRDTALNTSEDIKRVVWLVWSIWTLRLLLFWRVCMIPFQSSFGGLLDTLALIINYCCCYFTYIMCDVWNRLVENQVKDWTKALIETELIKYTMTMLFYRSAIVLQKIWISSLICTCKKYYNIYYSKLPPQEDKLLKLSCKVINYLDF